MAALALSTGRRRKILESVGIWLALLPLAILVIAPIWYLMAMAFTPE